MSENERAKTVEIALSRNGCYHLDRCNGDVEAKAMCAEVRALRAELSAPNCPR